MNDRELLELATKAAGLNAEWKEYTNAPPTMVVRYEQPIDGVTGYDWNPLEDDGDALRLAATLRIDIEFFASTVYAGPRKTGKYAVDVTDAFDPFAATRRAITRAAAEIGKAMP